MQFPEGLENTPFKARGPLGLKKNKSLGICKIYYSHFIFEVMYHYSFCQTEANSQTIFTQKVTQQWFLTQPDSWLQSELSESIL